MEKLIKERLLTGDRPTGRLHLGHYVGSLKNRVLMQDKYESFIMIADIQALTDNFDNPEKIKKNVFEVAVDNLAIGIDPKKSTIFIQSQIPEIAELTVFYSNLVSVSELEGNPTVKNEIRDKGHIFKNGNVTFGFLGYPVSQAADITFLRASIVPVGEDQKPIIEQTNKIIKKFHKYYGDLFLYPKVIYGEISRLSGLDGRKMSKSFNNAIYLSDSPKEVLLKIKKAKTDSDTKNLIRFDEINKPNISNLMQYYKIATEKSFDEIENEFKNSTSYKKFKDKLTIKLNNFLDPIRKKREYYENNPDIVWDILKKGNKKVKKEAEITMTLIKKHMKIYYE